MPSFQNPDGSFFEEATGDPIMVVTNPTSPVKMGQGNRSLYVNNPPATLAIWLPNVDTNSPGIGNTVTIGFSAAPTTLTWADARGNAVTGPNAATSAASAPIFRWIRAPVNAWKFWK
jgi:hypothetical protein